MKTLRRSLRLLALAILLTPAVLRAEDVPSRDYQPDPKSVQRYGPAYRYPQAGWIVLHVEGEPYDRGYQHGRLLAPEIAAYVRCFAALQSPKAPGEGWAVTRSLVNSLFVRRYDKEYLEEMRGIADGAAAAGARFENRPIDLVDVVAINSWPEVETLDSALNATPNGLEGMRFADPQPSAVTPPKPSHCSAFAATGPATADGKIVFGHITMFGLYPSNFFNVWIDLKPAKGHRVVMQSYPGGVQSGFDYYMNDAGLLVCETTIGQTPFNGEGQTVASRIRKALQYADNIDKAVEILKEGNNGLYTNEWLLADTKTNEIAMFELGTNKSKLYRSSKGEWFGGTEGFYWGCNNAKDVQVRLETVVSVEGRPANVTFHPSDRDMAWLKLYTKHKGKIDADWGRMAFTTPPIAKSSSVDAKVTTTDLAKELKSWALFGPPLGRSWQPTDDEKQKYPEVRPLVGNPWAVLHTTPPSKAEPGLVAAVDLSPRVPTGMGDREEQRPEDFRQVRGEPAWHGTLLPKGDADVWLTSAFANYERIAGGDRTPSRRGGGDRGGDLGGDRDRLATELYGYRSGYLAAARSMADVPLARTKSELARDEWYRVAAGKGVLVLHELRRLLGDKDFFAVMDAFGREHAGKEVTAAEFQAHVEKAAGKKVAGFFDYWQKETGLPVVKFVNKPVVEPLAAAEGKRKYRVTGELMRDGRTPPMVVDLTFETDTGDVTKRVELGDQERLPYEFEIDAFPKRVVLDKNSPVHPQGGAFTVSSWMSDLDQTLIVYGTLDEAAANREAAEALQDAIRRRGTNATLPVKADKDVTAEERNGHHLLLIGRPDTNSLTAHFASALPVTFGPRSFVVRGDSYAHADSAVMAAAENPSSGRYSVVVIAGLSAEATLRTASTSFGRRGGGGSELVVLPHGGRPRSLVVPAREMVAEFKAP